MNDDQIRKLVSKWQTRLKLDHWDVELEIVDSKAASVTHNYKYLYATIKVAKNHHSIPQSKKELSLDIIHEFLHLHLAGLKVIDGTPELIAEEQAVQILSRVILEGYEK